MRFVPIKSTEQQAVLAIHRLRQGLVEERTALINRLRGLLAEYGVIMGVGTARLRHALPLVLEDAGTEYRGLRARRLPMLHSSCQNSMSASLPTIAALRR